jgi:hypothetical protein
MLLEEYCLRLVLVVWRVHHIRYTIHSVPSEKNGWADLLSRPRLEASPPLSSSEEETVVQ